MTFLKDNRRDNSQDPVNQSCDFGNSRLSRFSVPDCSVIKPDDTNRAKFSVFVSQDSITGKEMSLERTNPLNQGSTDYDPLYIEAAYK